jgi:hypothetical protein
MTKRRVGTAVAVVAALLGVLAAAVALAGGTGDPADRASVGLPPPPGPAREDALAEAPNDARSSVPGEPAPPVADVVGRDVVRTAQLTLEVRDPAAATRGVRTAIAAAGGFVAAEQADPTGSWLVLRVPAAGLDRLVDDLAATGTVLVRSGRVEDATAQVVDLDSRVASQQASVVRVRALLAQARSIGDVVTVEAELARREADLDALERRLAAVRDQVALATLTVELRAGPAPAPDAAPPGFGVGLGAGWAGLRAVGVALATVAGFVLPFLPLVAVAGGAVWVVHRRRALRQRERSGAEAG